MCKDEGEERANFSDQPCVTKSWSCDCQSPVTRSLLESDLLIIAQTWRGYLDSAKMPHAADA